MFKQMVKRRICVLTFFLLVCVGLAWADNAPSASEPTKMSVVASNLDRTTDARVNALLQLLKTPIEEYQPTRVADVIDPHVKPKMYEVSWVNAPQYVLSASEMKTYKQPVKLQLTVIAATGYIGGSKLIASSGSKNFDQKVQKSLLVARLEPIPMVDKNLSYTVEHEFSLHPPQ
ncbi:MULTISPECIES: energy transducer TonB [unclassified Acinetobacter]|uniref:energy transducer TonB n=1 Tax=unclassified Acinetobacter TaxID=196816 RepID=UPI0015D2E675|nr:MULTISPECIES: energy transducer TonB [unclassified Acinetobacter]